MSDDQGITKVNIEFDDSHQKLQDDTLLYDLRNKLQKYRKLSCGILMLILASGLAIALYTNDHTHISRCGSIGIVIGIFFARLRFKAVEEAKVNCERSMRDPTEHFLSLLQKRGVPVMLSPEYGVKLNKNRSYLFSKEEVDGRVKKIADIIDSELFYVETLIIAGSTIVWGYADWLLDIVMLHIRN